MTKRRLCHCDTAGRVDATVKVICQHDSKRVVVMKFSRLAPPACYHPDQDWSYLPAWGTGWDRDTGIGDYGLRPKSKREVAQAHHDAELDYRDRGGRERHQRDWLAEHPTRAVETRSLYSDESLPMSYGGWRAGMECRFCGDRLVARSENLTPILDRLADKGVREITLGMVRTLMK